MQQAGLILSEMEALLNSLLDNAMKLLMLSQQVIEESELMSLQKEQEILLSKLIEKDSEFHNLTNVSQEKLVQFRLKIDKKIDDFQKLNAEFLENISAAHGLIQFDRGSVKNIKNKSKK